jgi:hypothetical protein
MSAVEQELTVFQGDDYTITLNFTDQAGDPADVSDRYFRAQVRSRRDSAAQLLADFVVDDNDAATGVVVLTLDAATTAELRRDCVYDIEQTVGGLTTTLFYGMVRLTRQVTVEA